MRLAISSYHTPLGKAAMWLVLSACTMWLPATRSVAQDRSLLPAADISPPAWDAPVVPEVLPPPDQPITPSLNLPPPPVTDVSSAAPVPAADELYVGPEWFDPGTWIPLGRLEGWDGSIEFGLNGTEGNTQALSYRTGFDLKRATKRYDWKVDLNYAKSSANGVETQHNALFNSNWDWKLRQTRWSSFSRAQLEYDRFKLFDIRLALNSGISYQLIETEITQWKTRLGAGASREFGGPADEWIPEGVFGFDLRHKLSERQTLETIIDYFPAWEDFSDYRLVTDTSWQVALDTASNLCLKIGVINRYDSTPSGPRANDLDYAVLLLWKM